MAARSSRFFAQVPFDLQMAVGLAKLTRYKAAIVAELLVAHYGLVEHRSIGINNTDYARSLGVDARQIRRDRRWLLESKLIVEIHADVFALNPDWRSWMDCDTQLPVIDAKSRTKIAAVVSRFSPEDKPKKVAPARTNESVHPDNPVLVALAHVGQGCPSSASPCRTNASGTGPECLEDKDASTPLLANDLQPPSRAGVRGRNLEIESREESTIVDSHSESAQGGDLIERVKALIIQATTCDAFPKGRPDHADLVAAWASDWLGDGHRDGDIRKTIGKAVSQHMAHEPTRLVAYVHKILGSAQEARLRPQKPLDVASIDPTFAGPVAGPQRLSAGQRRAQQAAIEADDWKNVS